MASKTFTAEEMREMAGHLIADISDTDNEHNEYRTTIGSFDLLDCEYALSYAADVVERCERIKVEQPFDSVINTANYILRGDAGNDNENK